MSDNFHTLYNYCLQKRCFRKKYNLINGIEVDFKAGRINEDYAKRVGLKNSVFAYVNTHRSGSRSIGGWMNIERIARAVL